MKNEIPDCKAWLRDNGYEDWAAKADEREKAWSDDFSERRIDWWAVFAGTPAGRPRKVDGIVFPMLSAARERQGFPAHADAIERFPGEMAPAIRPGRWKDHTPKTKASEGKPLASSARSIVDHSEKDRRQARAAR